MKTADLSREYRVALESTRREDLDSLRGAGVPECAIALARPAICRVRVAGDLYEPDETGGIAYLVPARVDGPLSPEAANTLETVNRGVIADLVAFHPAHPRRWALRIGVMDWLGSVEPQYLEPDPVPVWRSPIAWLRGHCKGLVVLSRDPVDAYRILTSVGGVIIAEDDEHAQQLTAILERPWPHPPIVVREARHVA